jgi:hypothetical protein
VTVGAAQQTARDEQHHPQAGAVVAGRGLVGMGVTESAFAVAAEFGLVRRVGRNPDTQIVPTTRFEVAKL